MLRPLYFLIKIMLVLALARAVGAFALAVPAIPASAPHYNSTMQMVEETMRSQDDDDRGEREALQHLAAQIRDYHAARYSVQYTVSGQNQTDYTLFYSRISGQITWGNLCGDGYAVSDEVIQAVAAKHGSMSDFKNLGCKACSQGKERGIEE